MVETGQIFLNIVYKIGIPGLAAAKDDMTRISGKGWIGIGRIRLRGLKSAKK